MNHSVTNVLNQGLSGRRTVDEKLLSLVYQELRIVARSRLGQSPDSDDLNTTALVHEAYLKLAPANGENPWKSRQHFYATAAIAMRQILIDQARKRLSAKRGGDQVRVTLDPEVLDVDGDCVDLLALDEALNQLEALDATLSELVHLRYFAGLPMSEVADVMQISKRTLERHWYTARAFLMAQLKSQ